MTDISEIQDQIKQLRASRPIDQRSDTGWDDLSSVRFQIAHTLESLLTEGAVIKQRVIEFLDYLDGDDSGRLDFKTYDKVEELRSLVSGTQRPIPTPPDWLDPESDR